MIIISFNKLGDELLEIITISQENLEHNEIFRPLPGSIIVVECNAKYLFVSTNGEINGNFRAKKETTILVLNNWIHLKKMTK